MNNGDYKNTIKYFEESIEYNNNEYGLLLCACIYYMGFGMKRNPKRAIYLFKETAIGWGNRVVEYYVGIMYKDGDGVKSNAATAMHWLTLSANQGLCDAQVNLGYMYQNGMFIKKDYHRALYYYKKALQMKRETTEIYLFGNNNNNKEFKLMYDSKELFLYQLSKKTINCCPNPLLTAKSYDQPQFPTKQKFYEINFWYTICKEQQHHVLVRSLIGELYFYGNGQFKRDDLKAKIWFEKAAKNGSVNGQLFMGSIYQYQKNYKQALIWYRMASKNVNEEALFKLAENYYYIEKDDIKAKYYCELVLDQTDHGQAYHMMGDIYSNSGGGSHQEINYTKAIHYYLKAVDHGCQQGATRLNLICQKAKLGMFKTKEL